MTDPAYEDYARLATLLGTEVGVLDKAAAEIARLHKIELQFIALQEERVRWFADNEWLTADNERLRAENQEAWNKLELSEERERKLRAALQEIKTKCGDPRIVSDIIRRALEPKP